MQLKKEGNIHYEIITVIDTPSHLEKEEITNFIIKNQNELRDNKETVFRCVEFAFGQFKHSGGFVIMARDSQKMNNPIVGCAVVNQTAMMGYVSENLLAYLTLNQDYLKQGIDELLLDQTLHFAKGNIDVHLFLNNENKNLFNKKGFSHAYQLYRLKRK